MFVRKNFAVSLMIITAMAVFAIADDDILDGADVKVPVDVADETSDINSAAIAEDIIDDLDIEFDEPEDDDYADVKRKKDKRSSEDDFEDALDEGDEEVVAAKPKSKSKEKKKSAESSETAAAPKAPRERTDFRLSGIVETGYDMRREINRNRANVTNNYMINRGEIEISARPMKGLRAEIGLEFNQRGTTHEVYPFQGLDALTVGPYITVDKFLAQYSMPWDGMFRAGIMKKSFGLEERSGTDERYFHSRSRVNDQLDDELGFLDHDLTIQYRHDINKNVWRFTGGLSWSVADSLRYLQNYSAQYNPRDDLTFIAAAVIRHDYISEERAASVGLDTGKTVTTFATSLNARYESLNWKIMNEDLNVILALSVVSEAEFTFGINPQIRLDRSLGNKEAYFMGVRLQEQFPISIETKTLRQIIPVAEGSVYWEDFDSGNYEIELRGGLALGFTKDSKLQFRNSFGLRLQMSDGEDPRVERYRYNSQVVLVF